MEGESGKEYETNFLADKCGLSGGWKAFSAAHKLVEGDVVVYFIRLFLINLKLRSILNWFLKKKFHQCNGGICYTSAMCSVYLPGPTIQNSYELQ